MADRFQSSIDVNASAQQCYACWRNVESFPQFMDHVESVTRQGDERFHWVIKGPLGKNVEFDAVIDGDEPGKLISWHSVSDPDVGVQGAVRFDETGAEGCCITVTMQYETPAGPLGEAVAKIFSNPERMTEEDLKKFKQLVESGSLRPYAGADHIGASAGSDRNLEYPDSGDIGGIPDDNTIL